MQEHPQALDDQAIRALAFELRTPLTSLLGYAQLLQRGDRINNPALVKDGLGLIETRASQLTNMVNRIARFAESGQATDGVDFTSANGLGELASQVAGGQSVDILFSTEADHATVDHETVAAVLRELLDNASRHGTGSAPIRIRGTLAGTPRRLVIRVANQGGVIPDEAREAIFAPFGKAEYDLTSVDAGLGLGLAMARRVAEAANGHLTLESGTPTTFRLELPVSNDPIAARFRALHDQADQAEAEAMQVARLLDTARGAENGCTRDELAAAYEQQMRAVEDFRRMHHQAIELTARLDRVYLEITAALARAVEARDEYTGSHVERVSRHAVRIGRALGLGDEGLRQIEFGGVLHDVGKIGVPDAVLGKAGALTPEEWETMRRHPIVGRSVLQGIAFLGPALDAVAHHHERWDGAGYPFGLAGEEIPLAGRIVAVADAFDAMTTDRPYRRGLARDVALSELDRSRSTAYDPEVVDAFLGTLELAS